MGFYKVPKGVETASTKVAKCDNPRCRDYRRAQAGKTAVTKWGRFFRLERWRWECPKCEQVGTHYMLLVF